MSDDMVIARFAHLDHAIDGDVMARHIEHALFDGCHVEALTKPKVFVRGETCELQYHVQVRLPSGDEHEALVLGTMFAAAETASSFVRTHLDPIAGPAHSTAVLESLGIALSRFPVSAALPTLVEMTNRSRIADELGRRPDAIERVRFTRTPRCVLRYHFDDDGPVVFGKVASTPSRDEVVRVLAALAGTDAIAVPGVVADRPLLEAMFLSALPGTRPALDEPSAFAVAARAAAALHSSGIVAESERPLSSVLHEARAAVDNIAGDAPALSEQLLPILDIVHAVGTDSTPDPLVLAHGDFTPSQLLVTESSVGVLDFDDVCRAETAFDLGRYLAYVHVARAKAGLTYEPSGRANLLTEYERFGGDVPSNGRVEMYELISLVVMAVHSWQRMKPARLHTVMDVLDRTRADFIRAASPRFLAR